jgi:hypothetical protein
VAVTPDFKPAAEAPAPLQAALERVASESEPRTEAAKPDIARQPGPAAENPRAAPPADSLASLFRRLEGAEENAAKPPPRRASFLDRWAR